MAGGAVDIEAGLIADDGAGEGEEGNGDHLDGDAGGVGGGSDIATDVRREDVTRKRGERFDVSLPGDRGGRGRCRWREQLEQPTELTEGFGRVIWHELGLQHSDNRTLVLISGL